MNRKARLSREERAVEKSLGTKEWESAPKSEITRHIKSAQKFVRSMRKEGRINIRITEADLVEIKKTADSEGLPYQTFMASILHKYVNGQLVERKVITELKRIIKSPKSAVLTKA